MTLDSEVLGAAKAVTAVISTFDMEPILRGLEPRRRLEVALVAYGAIFAKVGGLLGLSDQKGLEVIREAVVAEGRAYN